MQQNLTEEIILELDMIRIMSRLSLDALNNDISLTETGSMQLILEDIIKRAWNISELFEKVENKYIKPQEEEEEEA